MFYDLMCLSFLKYNFISFSIVTMYFELYIIRILTLFLFSTIYHIAFFSKKCETRVMEPSSYPFVSFSSLGLVRFLGNETAAEIVLGGDQVRSR